MCLKVKNQKQEIAQEKKARMILAWFAVLKHDTRTQRRVSLDNAVNGTLYKRNIKPAMNVYCRADVVYGRSLARRFEVPDILLT